MNFWQQKTPVISKLRVKGNELDALATRLHFERLLGATDFLPENLPPNAIICIKKIRDLRPRTFQLNPNDWRFPDAWRNLISREIENLYRRAFRPIREAVPAQAESVVFADNAELLACLASDWQRGLLAESWWWRGLFPNLGQAQTIARIWVESAEFAPAALQLLARQEKVVGFAVKLQPDEVKDLLRRIISAFGLNKLQKLLFEAFDKTEKEGLIQPGEYLIEKQVLQIQNPVSDEIQKLAPWFKLVPETRQISLNVDRQSLVGIGLMLARAPQIARSTEFARRLKIFKTEIEIYQKERAKRPRQISPQAKKAGQKPPPKNKTSPLPKREKNYGILTETGRGAKKNVAGKEPKIFEKPVRFEEIPVKSGESSEISSPETHPIEKKRTEKTNELFDQKSQTEKKSGLQTVKSAAKSRRKKKQSALQTDFTEAGETAVELPELIIATRFGGVFYLLNLGLYLKLYRDFTEAGEAEIDLNIWDFVALLGFAFLGEKIKNDAVWQLLKQLAGREPDEDFGKDFAAPDEWRIPTGWLETFQTNKKWLWTTDGRRLVVRHPENFSVFDVGLRDDLESQLKDELKIYRKDSSEIIKGEFKDFPVTFLGNLTEYAGERLRQALNLQTSEQIAEILFERSATATVTPTHLDVTFRLADLPFAVRLSGLDRDAGWIPAAGKFVKFYFI